MLGVLWADVTALVVLGPSPLPVDRSVLHWTVDHRQRWLVDLARAVTSLGSPLGVELLVLAAALASWWWRRGWRVPVTLVLTVAAAATLSSSVKGLVGRQRPPLSERVHGIVTTSSAYPSGHATVAAAGLGILALVWLRRRWTRGLAVVAIAAVGWSRVELGVHWPSDVVGGWLLGGLVSLVALGAHSTAPRPPR